MIGVFDSGRGGLRCAEYIRRALPHADIIYRADRKNAPYGTKCREELISLVTEDARALKALGAQEILIACCTASTVYDDLPKWAREVCTPIVNPTAKSAAMESENGKIGVMATVATVASDAFGKEIRRIRRGADVTYVAAQELVGIVERCEPLEVAEKYIRSVSLPFVLTGCDTLILGCTHFSHVSGIFRKVLPEVKIIDSALVGAGEIIRKTAVFGRGRTVYT